MSARREATGEAAVAAVCAAEEAIEEVIEEVIAEVKEPKGEKEAIVTAEKRGETTLVPKPKK